jgi:hypothetical protein
MSDADMGRGMQAIENAVERYENLYEAAKTFLPGLSSVSDGDYPGLGDFRKAFDDCKEDFED